MSEEIAEALLDEMKSVKMLLTLQLLMSGASRSKLP